MYAANRYIMSILNFASGLEYKFQSNYRYCLILRTRRLIVFRVGDSAIEMVLNENDPKSPTNSSERNRG